MKPGCCSPQRQQPCMCVWMVAGVRRSGRTNGCLVVDCFVPEEENKTLVNEVARSQPQTNETHDFSADISFFLNLCSPHLRAGTWTRVAAGAGRRSSGETANEGRGRWIYKGRKYILYRSARLTFDPRLSACL